MSFEGPEKINENPSISLDRLKEKIEKYPKLLSAALLVGMLSIDGARNTAEAQNEVTGDVPQSESTDAGVTLQGNAEKAPAHESDEGTVVTPRSGWIIPPTIDTPPEVSAAEDDNVSIGETYIDGKKITDE